MRVSEIVFFVEEMTEPVKGKNYPSVFVKLQGVRKRMRIEIKDREKRGAHTVLLTCQKWWNPTHCSTVVVTMLNGKAATLRIDDNRLPELVEIDGFWCKEESGVPWNPNRTFRNYKNRDARRCSRGPNLRYTNHTLNTKYIPGDSRAAGSDDPY